MTTWTQGPYTYEWPDEVPDFTPEPSTPVVPDQQYVETAYANTSSI